MQSYTTCTKYLSFSKISLCCLLLTHVFSSVCAMNIIIHCRAPGNLCLMFLNRRLQKIRLLLKIIVLNNILWISWHGNKNILFSLRPASTSREGARLMPLKWRLLPILYHFIPGYLLNYTLKATIFFNIDLYIFFYFLYLLCVILYLLF